QTAGVELWHTPDDEAYATLPAEAHHATYLIRSGRFRHWCNHLFYCTYEKAPGSQAWQDAMNVLEGQALHVGEECPIYVRLADFEDKVDLDLCNDQWQAVEIDADGWRIVDRAPVRFRRAKAMLPLPTPVKDGSVDRLRNYLNITHEGWPLVIAWLLGAFRS